MSRFQFIVKKLIGSNIINTKTWLNREKRRILCPYLIDKERKTQVIIVSVGSMSKCCVIIIFWFQNRQMSERNDAKRNETKRETAVKKDLSVNVFDCSESIAQKLFQNEQSFLSFIRSFVRSSDFVPFKMCEIQCTTNMKMENNDKITWLFKSTSIDKHANHETEDDTHS